MCLPGDHIAKWFPITEVATDTQPVYFTVPSNSLPVRAFNLGFAISTDEGEFAVFRVTIENQNLTRKWEWLYDVSLFGEGTFDAGGDVTWLSHLCVREGRDVQSGDFLKISIDARIDFEKSVKWGANILYEEQGAAGKGNAEQDDSCSCQDNWSTNAKTSWEDQDVEEEDHDAASWYDAFFRSSL